ncbi:hypothetical protein RHECNPAF_17000105 [Rhizobium etli CNPAF512]|nr:hypothetical protein RHECNPAF_17000105 [Rhizobium etli CNPAF512]
MQSGGRNWYRQAYANKGSYRISKIPLDNNQFLQITTFLFHVTS